MGAAASVRELVKERPIYRRERAIGLSIGAYLTSKILVLGIITGLQATLFTTIALLAGRSETYSSTISGSVNRHWTSSAWMPSRAHWRGCSGPASKRLRPASIPCGSHQRSSGPGRMS